MARETGFPITSTLMGLGAFPVTDRQFLGMLGMHGTYEANMAMHETDVLIAIGARFDDRVTGKIEHFCPHAKIIHIDVDPSSISKNVRVDVPIVGPVRVGARRHAEASEGTPAREPTGLPCGQPGGLVGQDRGMAAHGLPALRPHTATMIKPQLAVETLYKVTKGELYLTSDVGQHQMFAAQFYPFDEPRRWINSGGLGTMGFGLPAAMGVQLAFPDAQVACITGEASILMCIQEMATCMQYGLPIKVILLNNGYMGMVRQWQEFFYESRYSHSYVDALPDFVKLAESFGHVGMRIDRTRGPRGCHAGGLRPEGPLRLPRRGRGPQGERLPDDRGWQGPPRDAPLRPSGSWPDMTDKTHIISVLLENEAGALSRVAGLFSARGYNIESLTVAPTDDPTLSRMTLVTTGSDEIVEQIKKQLNKLIDVVKLLDLSEGPHIEREMMMIKLRAEGADREELKRLVDIFRGQGHRRDRHQLRGRAHRRLQEARRLHPTPSPRA